jgi:uncharacterized protein
MSNAMKSPRSSSRADARRDRFPWLLAAERGSCRADSRDARRDRFPWLLAAGPAIVVVASFATLALALTHDDALVASNYYKLGLTINRKLAAEPVRVAEGSATLTIAGDGQVRVRLAGMAPASLALSVHSPAHRDPVAPLPLTRATADEWTGVLRHVAPGRNLVALASAGWEFPVTIVERLPATVQLRAQSAGP